MESLYITIKRDLQEKILSGYYEEGRTIPTEHELSAMYQVSRPTIRRALQLLSEEGYVDKRKKRGTIVCQPKIQQGFTQIISSFDTEMEQKGRSSATKVIALKKEPAKIEVAEALGMKPKEEVYKLIRLRYVDGQPNVFLTTYVPADLVEGLLEADFTKERLYDIFEKEGTPIQFIRRKLETIKADETLAGMLEIEEGDPLFYFHSIGYNGKHKAIEYSIAKYRGDINTFVFELNTKHV